MREHWPHLAKSNPNGPWMGPIGEIVPEDSLPRSAQSILGQAQEYGWGFGPISLVLRMNMPGVPPFFMTWLYDLDSGRWHFDSARAANGQKLTYPDCRTVLQHPDALHPEAPKEPCHEHSR
jgi:hypothetical protein